jgi:hypothetical protein
MGQLGFFDADKRLAALSAKGDPFEAAAGSYARMASCEGAPKLACRTKRDRGGGSATATPCGEGRQR